MTFEVKNLNCIIDNKTIIEDINFTIRSGELNIIIGSNGAGKSTLLKSIARIQDSKGLLLLDEEDIFGYGISKIAQTISLMPQFNNNVHLTVKEILELGRRPYSGFTLLKEDYEMIDVVVAELELEKFLHRSMNTLSGGERQKVYLAKSLIQNPKILLLDEPISHLDPKNQQEILEIVKEITVKKDLITIMVLHDLQSALHYGDNLLLLKNGKLLNQLNVKDIKSEDLEELYDIKCKIFKNDGHHFVLMGHRHTSDGGARHHH
jgi:iron complex transport system ATP-binding protein